MASDSAGLEAAIAYNFHARELLVRALTHGSLPGELGAARVPQADNEQLEFLGDAVIGLVISEFLIRSCPDHNEGRLTIMKAKLVSRTHLASVAVKLRLGDYLLMGKAEESTGGRNKPILLSNALEALIAAVYLDGGIDPATRIIINWIVADTDVRALALSAALNVKLELEMLARARKLEHPEYSVRAESVNPHSFLAEVSVGENLTAAGRGPTKKRAELEAAAALLRIVNEKQSGAGVQG